MDASKLRKLAWVGPVNFWVVFDEGTVCLVAEKVHPVDPLPEGQDVTGPVIDGTRAALAAKCATDTEFAAGGCRWMLSCRSTQSP